MIAIISCTDRASSRTAQLSRHYDGYLKQQGQESKVFSLHDLPPDFFTSSVYGTPPPSFDTILTETILPATHVVFVVPEYNGSFPGVLKHFLDIVHPSVWKGKRTALAGLATGRAGNLRGLDHLMSVLHYLKAEVYHNKPLFSSIHLHLDAQQNIQNVEYIGLIKSQMDGFVKF